ncbi:MAG: KH domain-containing protein [Armatimonadia bacterium]
MVELVEYMVKALVDEPEAVSVSAVEGDAVTIYEVSVAPGDMGKVIGRHGRIANALRNVVKAAAMKSDQRATVEIVS